MSFTLNALFSMSVGIGAIIGWIRYVRTDPAFLPFIILLSLGFFNELLSIILISKGYHNAINYDVFELAEGLLLTWQFYRWQLFHKKSMLYLLQIFFISIWVLEIVNQSRLHLFQPYYHIIHAFSIVLMSISLSSRLIFQVSAPLFTDPVFLICTALILYFTYAIIVEAFIIYGLSQSQVFRLRIYIILSYINLFSNLLFALAILWIPLKRHYLLRC